MEEAHAYAQSLSHEHDTWFAANDSAVFFFRVHPVRSRRYVDTGWMYPMHPSHLTTARPPVQSMHRITHSTRCHVHAMPLTAHHTEPKSKLHTVVSGTPQHPYLPAVNMGRLGSCSTGRRYSIAPMQRIAAVLHGRKGGGCASAAWSWSHHRCIRGAERKGKRDGEAGVDGTEHMMLLPSTYC